MKDKKAQSAISNTYTYMENYREMERYIKDAVSEASQINDVGKYSISAETAYLRSIRECRAETIILYEHINRALESLRKDAEATGELHKYTALEMHYIKGMTYEEIADELGSGNNSPKRWCKSMMEKLSIKLFGAKVFENN